MAEHHTKKCLKIAWFGDVDIENAVLLLQRGNQDT